jgi:anti-sigma regulatory factor (Ser/Thr protein kinase)
MPEDAALLTLELPSRSEAPSAARKALTALNGNLHLLSTSRLRDVQLLVSEIVTNAVIHGPDTESIGLAVLATDEMVRVEISDRGNGFTPPSEIGKHEPTSGGWGLPIIDAIAQRWGVEQAGGTTVWFEVDRPRA